MSWSCSFFGTVACLFLTEWEIIAEEMKKFKSINKKNSAMLNFDNLYGWTYLICCWFMPPRHADLEASALLAVNQVNSTVNKKSPQSVFTFRSAMNFKLSLSVSKRPNLPSQVMLTLKWSFLRFWQNSRQSFVLLVMMSLFKVLTQIFPRMLVVDCGQNISLAILLVY